MERNKVKIQCNPYSKTVKYKRWGRDTNDDTFKWLDLGSKSKLIIEKKFSHVTIQHNACEIINEIAEEYNRGNAGLDIVFDGTEEDYFDLKDVVEQFYSGSGIECKMGDLYLESAEIVMPKIQKVFDDMSKVFSEYKEKTNSIVEKYLDATKTVIPICVVGMYSTGKSAFINALIGEEVLPSAVNPTTARNYKIVQSEKKGKICFLDKTDKIEIIFDNQKYNIIGNIVRELKTEIERRLGEKIESIHKGLYESLSAINEYADKTGEIAEMIEVEVPFCEGVLKSDEYDFVIYDTPGSDSKSHEEHIKVLKNALGEQTNGLPIVLTSPKDMDRTGADSLLKVVNGIDGNLDLTNAMIIVNQADGVSSKSLDKIKLDANTLLNQWKSNRLYFMSAILGLGSKKSDYNNEYSWIDDDYSEVFFKNSDYFWKKDSKFYKQLYMHNQMAENRKNEYVKQVDDCKRERDLIYINSGLHCVEMEIVEFAKRFALYNKCAQAEDYLNEAMECTAEIINDKENRVNKLNAEICEKLETTKTELSQKLSYIIQQSSSQFQDEYPNYILHAAGIEFQNGNEKVSAEVDALWGSLKEEDKNERVSRFLKEIDRKYKIVQEDIRKKLSIKSKEFCDKKREEIQKDCCKLIKEDENLTKNEQEYLNRFVMELKPIRTEVGDIEFGVEEISKFILNVFGFKAFRRNTVDTKKTKGLFDDNLKRYVTRINQSVVELHKNDFKKWNRKLETGLIKEMGNLNPTLKEYAREIGKLQAEIEEFQKIQQFILKNQLDIKNMFEFKTREGKE